MADKSELEKRVREWLGCEPYPGEIEDIALFAEEFCAEKEKEVEELRRKLADEAALSNEDYSAVELENQGLKAKLASAQAVLSEIYKLWQSCRPDLPFEIRAKIVFELEEKFQQAMKE